ncbi:hypothetical protein F2Q68_00042980 [Brassica cretica]|uniref:Uncharacterized protein n=1 Tax=Brassica cretica TaxID=69181 RepID=A0A8S9LH31_BRACR|nr:hypothetical protein F2Q68_00042980 [Brassica cretica]
MTSGLGHIPKLRYPKLRSLSNTASINYTSVGEHHLNGVGAARWRSSPWTSNQKGESMS